MPIKNLKQKYLLSILFFSVIGIFSMFLPYFKYTIKIETAKKTGDLFSNGGIFSDLPDYTFYTIKINGFEEMKKIIDDPVKLFRFNYYTFLFLIFIGLLWICYLIIKELL